MSIKLIPKSSIKKLNNIKDLNINLYEIILKGGEVLNY